MEYSFSDADNFIRNLVTIRHGPGHGRNDSPPARKMSRDMGLPIPTDEIIADLRLDSDDEEATLERLERGAADFLERRTGLVVIPGVYQIMLEHWWLGTMDVIRAPLRQLEAVEYLAEDHTWTEVDTDNFHVDDGERSFSILALSSFVRPQLWSEARLARRIRLTFSAGYELPSESGSGDGPQMPDSLRTTLLMLIGHYYENRELFMADKIADVELSAGGLLGLHRQFW